jgi:hypothetical protein
VCDGFEHQYRARPGRRRTGGGCRYFQMSAVAGRQLLATGPPYEGVDTKAGRERPGPSAAIQRRHADGPTQEQSALSNAATHTSGLMDEHVRASRAAWRSPQAVAGGR